MAIYIPEKTFGDYKVRLMKASDAPGIIDLYRAIYGDHYPIKEMYDPRFIVQQQEAGMMYRVIVVDADEKVLAQQALYRLNETYQGLYESGQGMVLPECRGKGFNDAIIGYMAQALIPAMGVEEWWGESVANHVFMQKSAIFAGAAEFGLELDVMPAESYAVEKSASARVSIVVGGILIKERPHTVFLPAPYAKVLTRIYQNGNRDRRMEAGTQALPEADPTCYKDTFIASAGVLRVTIYEAGKDADDVIVGLVQKYAAAGAVVFQMIFPLGKAWSGALTDILNRRGFFFAAVMPRWFDADGLMLQKLVQPTDYKQIRLHTDFMKEMLRFIIQDQARVEALSTM